MRLWMLAGVLMLGGVAARGAAQGEAAIRVRADAVTSHLSPWMYGSCIEDVNHEIYGGLYSQMIFGESFEEPPLTRIPGWSAYGGEWEVRDGLLHVQPNAGAKVVRTGPDVADADVSCEVRVTNPAGDNAGLILRVQNPRTGADTWTGYEISISPLNHAVILGRHRENWTPLRSAPAPIQVGQWYRLRVQLAGARIRIYLDDADQPLIDFTDPSPVLSGRVGLRTWNSEAEFRRVVVQSAGANWTEEFRSPASGRTDTVSGMWDTLHTGSAIGHYTWDAERPFNTAHSQKLELSGAGGTAGLANRGLNRWGLSVRSGHRYAGRIYLRGQAYAGAVTVALQSADGAHTYAEQRLAGIGGDWRRFDFSLRPGETDANARFAVWIDQPGAVWVDQVFLGPTSRDLFHGLPVRADIAEGLIRQGLTVMRYGGSMVNAPEYRWKQMIGDPDRRPQYRGWWYPASTNGFGIEEFLRFCEAARFEPVFAINIDETDADAADLVEYLNGPVSTTWGARRAKNGHPKPYGVRYIEIGNEEAINGDKQWYRHYLDRFHHLHRAMHAQDPNLQLIVAAWWRPGEPLVKQIAQGVRGEAALWDVHVGGDDLREGPTVDRIFTEMERLFQEWSPGTPLKACVLEENGGRHDVQRALGHARVLSATQRHGDFVRMDCPANCLQPWRQNDNGWDQGQLFFTPSQVWGMPPYYAQQMVAQNALPLRVESTVAGSGEDLDVTALRSEKGDQLVLRVVNAGAAPRRTAVRVDGMEHLAREGRVWTLQGALTDRNTPEEPERIHPQESVLRGVGPEFTHEFPAHSLTVIRLRKG